MHSIPPINHHSVAATHRAASVGDPTPDKTTIANGMNAFWLLFADNTLTMKDGKTRIWKAQDPNLNGFGLGNPNLNPALQGQLIAVFQQLITNTDGSPTAFMNALSASKDPNEQALGGALSYYAAVGTDSLAADVASQVKTYIDTGKYDTSQPMGQILDTIQNHTASTKYPATYVPALDGFAPETPLRFKEILNDIEYLNPDAIANNDPTEIQSFADLIAGKGDYLSQANLMFLVGAGEKPPNADGAADPIDTLIRSLISQPLGSTHKALADWAWQIQGGGTLPNPTDNPEFFAAFKPGGIGRLLMTLGYYGNWMMPPHPHG